MECIRLKIIHVTKVSYCTMMDIFMGISQFPKELHTGVMPIHYGYSFKFSDENELDSFLESFNRI